MEKNKAANLTINEDLIMRHIILLYIYTASVTIETVLLYSNFIMYKALATV